MRIVVDFQGAQTPSRYRGIGRYVTAVVKSMICRAPQHEFILVLNGQFDAGIESIRAEMGSVMPQSRIRVWHSPGPTGYAQDAEGNLRQVAEAVREHYLRSLEPDLILITSLFEGLGDDAVVSVKKYVPDIPVACIFYDLTPLILPDIHFQTSAVHRRWYRDRIASLRQCDVLLAISESSRLEALTELDFAPDQVVNIFGGHSDDFVVRHFGSAEKEAVQRRFGLDKPFILYTGGVELNKNLKTLVEGLSHIPATVRDRYRFVCVGRRKPGEVEEILGYAQDPVVRDMITVAGYVCQDDLIDLYNACDLFVFPSLREGFGLPALEAMACGAPTIVSDRASLPEIVENPDALFDPESPRSIGAKMTEVLTNPDLQARLIALGLSRAKKLTWDACADKALRAFDKLQPRAPIDENRRATVLNTGIFGSRKLSILVQKLDHHGDFFLGLPALAKLRARYPDARIDGLIGSWNRDAAIASGLLDNIYIFDYFKAKSSDRPSLSEAQLEVFRDMPYYDYALDLRRQPDTRFILFKANANAYFGYKTGDGNIDSLLTAGLDAHPEPGGARNYFENTHTSEQILRIVDALPFDVNDYLNLPQMGERLPQKSGAIAIFPRVGLDARQWDSVRFGQLMTKLVASKQVTEINIYAGKPEELDIIPLPDHAKLRIHCGLRFGELAASLSGNQICVGNNSFGVHLASYVGCKTIGIYSGHELPQQWGPAFGDAKAIMIDAACAPCHLPSREACPFDMLCLEDISVKAVLDLVLAEIAGVTNLTYRAEIVAANPASAIPALVNDINALKSKGYATNLSHEQRVALSAAMAINFPERGRRGFNIYVDVSNFRSDVDVDVDSIRTHAKWQTARAFIASIKRHAPAEYDVIPMAAGQHDHEFYAVPFEHIEDLSVIAREGALVQPIAGDIYLGTDSYLFRNSAQWDLLFSWRMLGVTSAFLLLSSDLDRWNYGRAEGEQAERIGRFLMETLHFDMLITSSVRHRALDAWVTDHMPPRERPLVVRHGEDAETVDAQAARIMDMLIDRPVAARPKKRALPRIAATAG